MAARGGIPRRADPRCGRGAPLRRLCKGVRTGEASTDVDFARLRTDRPAVGADRPAAASAEAALGRPAGDHRQVRNGLLRILRTGAPWKHPLRSGSLNPKVELVRPLAMAGVVDRVLQRLQTQPDYQSASANRSTSVFSQLFR
ncbi:hypothetical protein DK427_02890 [Methylobacterium radiodurans]|uniref:Transposase n=1 Tax=Methylobacterium radiodurans TaxID=2202828 RepID=A0A2U8VN55_9HYPH|nr:hypothetical protein DK427_02890 [Methylobacterium radiodurans]